MDDVLVDFQGAACKLFNGNWEQVINRKEYDMCPTLGISQRAFWSGINAYGEQFWLDLKELDWFNEVWELCHVYSDRVIIVSSPSQHVTCHTGKVKWLQRKFDDNFRDFCLFGQKELFAGPNRYLIDDKLENCINFTSAGGKALMFPAPGNELSRFNGDMEYFKYELEIRMAT